MEDALRLIAQDDEDLKILSAHLQDSVLRVRDLVYQAAKHRFIIMLNRFCWETGENVRTRSGLHFDGVLSVKSRGFAQDDGDAVLQLLALQFVAGEDGGGAVDLYLAGGGAIRLEVECISASLSDLTERWPAQKRPAHDIEEEERR